MQQNLLMPAPVKDVYEPRAFGLKLTELFGPQFTWASLRHPRRDVIFLELGHGPDHTRHVARRINPQGLKLIKPIDGLRWEPWDGQSDSGPYNAECLDEQFALLGMARRTAPLTAHKPKLWSGSPLEPVI